jgi:hypothetical protein
MPSACPRSMSKPGWRRSSSSTTWRPATPSSPRASACTSDTRISHAIPVSGSGSGFGTTSMQMTTELPSPWCTHSGRSSSTIPGGGGLGRDRRRPLAARGAAAGAHPAPLRPGRPRIQVSALRAPARGAAGPLGRRNLRRADGHVRLVLPATGRSSRRVDPQPPLPARRERDDRLPRAARSGTNAPSPLTGDHSPSASPTRATDSPRSRLPSTSTVCSRNARAWARSCSVNS